jgi:hypothetical protein
MLQVKDEVKLATILNLPVLYLPAHTFCDLLAQAQSKTVTFNLLLGWVGILEVRFE